ncbi:hypothetical protein SS37A_21860 [Methylocystis iwaonis]|uniref:Transposase n=1 Tax=Methylocystis iwaonis TaxID=2885079 RepID=A0ABN6VIA8_9HYPH|nr:hypothetical protein SS37A_21860 [Methylocystis iwaonis]
MRWAIDIAIVSQGLKTVRCGDNGRVAARSSVEAFAMRIPLARQFEMVPKTLMDG